MIMSHWIKSDKSLTLGGTTESFTQDGSYFHPDRSVKNSGGVQLTGNLTF